MIAPVSPMDSFQDAKSSCLAVRTRMTDLKSIVLLTAILILPMASALSECQDNSQCPAGTSCSTGQRLCNTYVPCDAASDLSCKASLGLDNSDYMYLCVAGYCHILASRCLSSSDCLNFEYCSDKACNLRSGYCEVNSDCTGQYQFCNTTTNHCAMQPGRCNSGSDCLSYQSCGSLHNCVPRQGRCDSNQDCHLWQDCNGTNYCALQAGRSQADSDCLDYQQCKTDTNYCHVRAGFCDTNSDCASPNTYCNPQSNTCAYLDGYCASDLDCVVGYCDNGRCTQTPATQTARNDVVLIFDNSGSMSGDNKINRSRDAAVRTLGSIQNDQTRYALFSFNQCTPVQNLNFTSQNGDLVQQIRLMSPLGSTPLASTLDNAYQYIKNSSTGRERAFILLFTDGQETCNGDPCAVVKNYSANLKVPVYTIGYIVGAGEESQLQCIAQASGGAYYPAGNDADLLNKMRETLYVAGVACSDNSQCPSRFVCQDQQCVPAKLHLVFVRLNNLSTADFQSDVESQEQVFLHSIPSLAACTDRIRMTALDDACQVDNLGSDSAVDYAAVQSCLASHIDASEYDYFVAIAPTGGLTGMPGADGYMSWGTNGVFVTAGNPVLTAHEMGHQFGLYDEYCSNGVNCNLEPNPLRNEYGCDVNGSCCWSDFRLWPPPLRFSCSHPYGAPLCCEGNQSAEGGRSIMSWSDADGPRAHDEPSLEYLAKNPLLRCDT